MAFIHGLNRVRLGSLYPGGGLGGSGFWPLFPALFPELLLFPFILACLPYPTSTCGVRFSKTDTCPISPYPKWLGVVVKAGEYGSIRCRVLNGSKGSFPWSLYFPAYPFLNVIDILDFFPKLFLYHFFPFLLWDLGYVEDWIVLDCVPRLLRICIAKPGPSPSSAWAFRPQQVNGLGPRIIGPHNSPSKPCCPTS